MSSRIQEYTAAGTATGNELLPASQLSTTVTYTATTLSAQASDNSINDSAAQFVAEGFAVGDSVKVDGFTGNAANNKTARTITAITTAKMTFGGSDGDDIVDDAAGESVTITKWAPVRLSAQDIADLSAIDGLTATTDNLIVGVASAWASRTPAQASATLQGDGLTVDLAGYRGIPQNSQSAAYTLVAADAGKHILHPSSDANARTFTIPANGSVAFPVGTTITFVNQTSEVVSIAITTDTLTLANSTTTGTRSLARNGVATALKVASTSWIISGAGVS